MALDDIKNVIRRMIQEDLNTGNPAMSEVLFAPDFVDHTNPQQWQYGIEGHKQIFCVGTAQGGGLAIWSGRSGTHEAA